MIGIWPSTLPEGTPNSTLALRLTEPPETAVGEHCGCPVLVSVVVVEVVVVVKLVLVLKSAIVVMGAEAVTVF